jgi:hypothetical protein
MFAIHTSDFSQFFKTMFKCTFINNFRRPPLCVLVGAFGTRSRECRMRYETGMSGVIAHDEATHRTYARLAP